LKPRSSYTKISHFLIPHTSKIVLAVFTRVFCYVQSTEGKKGSKGATSGEQNAAPDAASVAHPAGGDASSDPAAAAAATNVARGSMESRLGQLASLQRRLRSSIPGADLFGELRKSRNSTASVAAGATAAGASVGGVAAVTGGALVGGGVDEYLYEYEFSGPGFDLDEDDDDESGYMGGNGSAAKAIKAAEEVQVALRDEIGDLQDQLAEVKNEFAMAKANAKRTLREV